MASPAHKTVYAVALTALAGALFIAGTETALAPDRESAVFGCVPGIDEARGAAVGPALTEVSDPAQRALADYLSRRFAIAGEATGQMVGAAYRAANEVGLDPLLVLAVISVESRFNPIAESAMGAKGLMQIIPRYHLARFDALGGEAAVLDLESNILVGARILQEYVYRTGTLEAGLQFYNGAMADGSALYAQKVFVERERIEAALKAALRSALVTQNTKGS
jgi:soluble lytic murein transglycosylase-like protein